ncbi:MAG TPA: hypothetical protein VIT19_06100 [Pyrinomonadaceae bacterium]
MNKSYRSRNVMMLALVALMLCPTLFAQAQQRGTVAFASPDGFLPAELSKHVGAMFLSPKTPAGLFVGYPSDGQDMDGFRNEMQQRVVKMFLHDAKDVTWTATPLPPHKGISEAGNLFYASTEKMEVQLAFYVRSEGVAYGYYAMRHKNDGGKDGKFLKSDGTGVKALDSLAKTIVIK